MILNKEQERILEEARKTYGSRNQLAVAAEECNELAIAVLKFMRYDDEHRGVENTRVKVLEERADVEIVLNHIDSIYGFKESDIASVVSGKIERLKRWLEKTDSMEYTMIDRTVSAVPKKDCSDCFYFEHYEEGFEACKNCARVHNKLKQKGSTTE